MTVSQGTPKPPLSTERIRNMYTWAVSWRAEVPIDRTDLMQLQIDQAAEFDAWLADHDAGVEREASAKALTDAADEYKSGQLTGIFMGRDDYTKEWLRARAAKVREARP